MNLLINESSLHVLLSLVMKVGLNEVIMLQQLHFKLSISSNGQKWVYKTKWDQINYSKPQIPKVQNATSTKAKSVEGKVQIASSTEGNMPLPITKEIKIIKKEIVENALDVVSVIDYLNNKSSKSSADENLTVHSVYIVYNVYITVVSSWKTAIEEAEDAHIDI